MTLLAHERPKLPAETAFDPRPVLLVVDLAHPLEAVLHRAITTAAKLRAPLSVVALHERSGFTTDAAVAARQSRRLAQQRVALERKIEELRIPHGLDYRVRLVPYARWPLGRPAARAQRAATLQTRGLPCLELIMAEHLAPGTCSAPHASARTDTNSC